MKLRFLAEALVEYEDAIEYYERAQSGLGDTFIRDVEETLALTLEFPEMGAPVADTRWTLVFGAESSSASASKSTTSLRTKS